jgi:hypothetical protein
VFDERAVGNHLLELVLGDEVVVFSISLAWAWRTRCVWIKDGSAWTDRGYRDRFLTRDTEPELGRVVCEEPGEQRGFAHARWTRQHQRSEEIGGDDRGRHLLAGPRAGDAERDA